MPGGGWLRNAENRHEIADAKLSIPQQMQDAKPRWIGKRSKHNIDLSSRH